VDSARKSKNPGAYYYKELMSVPYVDRSNTGESKSTWYWRLHAMSLSERRLAYPDKDGDSTTAIICAKFRKNAFPWGGNDPW
jgi:hypothetical protein